LFFFARIPGSGMTDSLQIEQARALPSAEWRYFLVTLARVIKKKFAGM
jgi:hypothetical protein